MSHFKDHPAVIGYQIDNETFPNGVPTKYANAAFLERLKRRYQTPATINKTWWIVYRRDPLEIWHHLAPRDVRKKGA